MAHLFIFGLGYSARAVARRAEALGMRVSGTGRSGNLAFDDAAGVRARLAQASHVLSSVPPDDAGDPVMARYGDALGHGWLGYLSSTGVYGDTGGAWVDETAPTGSGRRSVRSLADAAWLARGARVFRLPGIYGPGRSALERVRAGDARRVALAGQVFSRVHLDDIASGVIAGLSGAPGAYNLADDEPAANADVIAEACRLLGQAVPPAVPLAQAGLSPAAQAFYAENRRAANGKARRVLGWQPAYPTYREGLRAVLRESATSSPASATTDPAMANPLQR